MWELYSLFAPKPLYLAQGKYDELFPEDLFYKNARQVATTYQQLAKTDNFLAEVMPKNHPWDCESREALGNFFSKVFEIEPAEKLADDRLETIDPALSKIKIPDGAINVDQLVAELCGIKIPPDLKLEEVYKPRFQGRVIAASELIPTLKRGETMQILAQFEAFL